MLALTLTLTPTPETPEFEEVEQRFTKIIFERAPEPVSIAVNPQWQTEEPTEDVDTAAPAQKKKKRKTKRRKRTPVARKKLSKNRLDKIIAQRQGVVGAMRTRNMKRQLNKLLLGNSKYKVAALGLRKKSPESIAGSNARGRVGSKTSTRGAGQMNTVDIKDVQTKARGSGRQGFGDVALAGKSRANIVLPSQDDVAVEGTIDRSQVSDVIQRNLTQIKYCYESQLYLFPKLKGKVVVQWVINENGSVSDVKIASSTMGNRAVEQCMVRRIRQWGFPKPGGGIVIIRYPFVFVSTSQG
jgi:TonB family protein